MFVKWTAYNYKYIILRCSVPNRPFSITPFHPRSRHKSIKAVLKRTQMFLLISSLSISLIFPPSLTHRVSHHLDSIVCSTNLGALVFISFLLGRPWSPGARRTRTPWPASRRRRGRPSTPWRIRSSQRWSVFFLLLQRELYWLIMTSHPSSHPYITPSVITASSLNSRIPNTNKRILFLILLPLTEKKIL